MTAAHRDRCNDHIHFILTSIRRVLERHKLCDTESINKAIAEDYRALRQAKYKCSKHVLKVML